MLLSEYLYCLMYTCGIILCIYKYLDRKPSWMEWIGISLMYGFINFIITGDYVIDMNRYILINTLVLVSDFVLITIINRKVKWSLMFYSSLYTILFMVYINVIMYFLDNFKLLTILESYVPSLERFVLVAIFNILSLITFKGLEKIRFIPSMNIIYYEYKSFNLINIISYFVLLIFFGSQMNKMNSIYSLLIIIAFMVLFLLLIKTIKNSINLSIDNQNRLLSETIFNNIEEYLEQQKKEEEKITKIRHDMRNHLLILKNISTDKKVKEYIDNVDDGFKRIQKIEYINSGNVYIDAIINIKTQQYNYVKLTHLLDVSSLQMDPKDLSSLIFNLLDNAMKEASKIKGEVNLQMIYDSQNVFIRITNDCAKEPTFVSSRRDHGYGLIIIKDIVQKYNKRINV